MPNLTAAAKMEALRIEAGPDKPRGDFTLEELILALPSEADLARLAKRPKWQTKHSPLDCFLISGHMHMGASSSGMLMGCLGKHPAVRSLGMVSCDAPGNYDEQALSYLREGRINTLFIDPGNVQDDREWFDSGPFLDRVRKEFPEVVIVLYTWDRCRTKFISVHPRFSHFLYLNNESFGEWTLNPLLAQCEYWHKTRYEYDLALSFAGEDRVHAEEAALQLKAEGLRVFYDEFEKSRLIGKNLSETLYEIYSMRCRHTVIFASKNYQNKIWTSHERRAAQERVIRERGGDFILPIRIDDSEITALPQSTAYLRIEDGIDTIVDLLVQKLYMVDPNQPKAYVGRRLY